MKALELIFGVANICYFYSGEGDDRPWQSLISLGLGIALLIGFCYL